MSEPTVDEPNVDEETQSIDETPRFEHARHDDILNGDGELVFEKDFFYTPAEVNQLCFCAFRNENNGVTKFRCAMALRNDGDHLCQTHHRLWVAQRKQQEQQRLDRREKWFKDQCEKEYNNIIQNGHTTFSAEVTTKEEKEAIMWKMAQAMVRSRDRYAGNQ